VGSERTSVGHPGSVAAAAIDGVTGEVFRARLTPDYGQWCGGCGPCPDIDARRRWRTRLIWRAIVKGGAPKWPRSVTW